MNTRWPIRACMSFLIHPEHYEVVPSGRVSLYFPTGFEFVEITTTPDGRTLGFYVAENKKDLPRNVLAGIFLKAFCADHLATVSYRGDILLTLGNDDGDEIDFPPDQRDAFSKLLDGFMPHVDEVKQRFARRVRIQKN